MFGGRSPLGTGRLFFWSFSASALAVICITEQVMHGGLSEVAARPTTSLQPRPGARRVEVDMSDERHFERLLREFERVGIDPNTISAGLAVRPDDVLQVLRSLPDDAGPAAFLQQLRLLMTQGARE